MNAPFFRSIKTYLSSFKCAEDAATAIEYCLIAAGIALAIIATVFLMGGDVFDLYSDVQTTLSSNL